MTHPAFQLRTALRVAARAAYLEGATDRQIDMLVALARGADRFDLLSGGHLTKRDASRMIDELLAAGVEPDHNKSDAELDAEDAAASQVESRIAYRQAKKHSDKAGKAAREAAHLEAARAGANGQRVRHPKYGEGDVIAWDDTSITAIYPGQRKPIRILRTFLTEV